METLWFWILTFMLSMYVILDGFDLGVGMLHLLVGKNEHERRIILNAIGPVWDGNEVWLLAAGATLYFAFPILYASSFSGFYLPLMIVLWLLMLRGLGIEFRHHLHNPLWKSFWDVVFSVASVLLVLFFGAALGNVVRGVPLKADGFFFVPLWTTFTVTPDAGVLDWFTTLMGLVAIAALSVHGANYLSMKTEGELQARCRSFATRMWGVVVVLTVLAMVSTFYLRPGVLTNFSSHPPGILLPAVSFIGILAMLYYRIRGHDTGAFVASSVFIGSMLATTAYGLYPKVLPASTGDQYDLTIHNSATHTYGMSVGIVWFSVGILLVAAYFTYLYRSFRGKVSLPEHGEGY